MLKFRCAQTAALVLLACVALPALGQPAVKGILGEFTPGFWELRSREKQGKISRLCVKDPQQLIQLRHPNDSCRKVVVDEKADEATVQYTCPKRGYGRTHIRKETNTLLQIDGQGIASGQPFSFVVEGRRIGDCPR